MKEKFSSEVFEDGFTTVPNSCVFDDKISGLDKTVFMVICAFAWGKKSSSRPGQKTIGQIIGKSRVTVNRCIKNLIQNGHIKATQGGDGQANTYIILGKFRCITSDTPEIQMYQKSISDVSPVIHKENNESNNKDLPLQGNEPKDSLLKIFKDIYDQANPFEPYIPSWGQDRKSQKILLAEHEAEWYRPMIEKFIQKIPKSVWFADLKTLATFQRHIMAIIQWQEKGGNNGSGKKSSAPGHNVTGKPKNWGIPDSVKSVGTER